MKEPLLSIVVPTKDRYPYLKSFVELVASFEQDGLELVIQDNSQDNREFLSWLDQRENSSIRYYYESGKLSMTENSERATEHATGKYICFMGDDDFISKYLYPFVESMERNGWEAAVFQEASYNWPGVVHKAHHFPSLFAHPFHGVLEQVSMSEEKAQMLQTGGTRIGRMPHLYHGVVLREKLEEIRKIAGTYFPGPSPDMAAAVALLQNVRRIIWCDVPLISSGTAPKSGSALGATHQHKGSLQNVSWLPADVEAHWEQKIPMVWTGPTIWAESAVKALRAMGEEEALRRFNYTRVYAALWSFVGDYRADALAALHTGERLRFWWYVLDIFVLRSRIFLKNALMTRFGLSKNKIWEHVPDTVQAGNLLDAWIAENHLDVDAMFQRLKT